MVKAPFYHITIVWNCVVFIENASVKTSPCHFSQMIVVISVYLFISVNYSSILCQMEKLIPQFADCSSHVSKMQYILQSPDPWLHDIVHAEVNVNVKHVAYMEHTYTSHVSPLPLRYFDAANNILNHRLLPKHGHFLSILISSLSLRFSFQ